MNERVSEILPYFLLEKLLQIYIKTSCILEQNKFTYEVFDRNISFYYTKVYQFFIFYNMIDDNKIVEENIPIKLFRSLDDCDAFIDIGANYGIYTTIVGRLDQNINIHSFEPNDKNRKRLVNTLDTNNINASIHSDVVSDSTGEITFYVNNDDHLAHSTSRNGSSDSTTKQSISISEFLNEADTIDPFIKIDAEGEEYNILNDICECECLNSIRGVVETHPDKMDKSNEQIEYLLDNNFEWQYLADTAPNYQYSRLAYYFKYSTGE